MIYKGFPLTLKSLADTLFPLLIFRSDTYIPPSSQGVVQAFLFSPLKFLPFLNTQQIRLHGGYLLKLLKVTES